MHRDYRNSSRQRLKACYQRNMMIGMLGAIIVFALPVSYFSWQFAPKSTSPPSFKNIFVQDQTVMTPPSTPPTKRNVNNRKRLAHEFNGQFGGEYRIIPDQQSLPVPAVAGTKILTRELDPTYTDIDISISDMDEGTTGSYVPPGGDYWFEYRKENRAVLTDRPCSVLTKLEPSYPRVAEDAGKEGQVVLILPLDAGGNKVVFTDELTRDFISRGYRVRTLEYEVSGGGKREFNVVIAKEEPTDWFFASNLLKVISQWTFTPWVEDGKPVSALLTIRHQFCLGNNCLKYEFINQARGASPALLPHVVSHQ